MFTTWPLAALDHRRAERVAAVHDAVEVDAAQPLPVLELLSRNGPATPTPALLTSTSTGPCVADLLGQRRASPRHPPRRTCSAVAAGPDGGARLGRGRGRIAVDVDGDHLARPALA
jgi:hypothetical protein